MKYLLFLILVIASACSGFNIRNSAPTGADDNIETNENIMIEYFLFGSDKEGDKLSFSITQQPTNGTLTKNNNFIQYTPNNGYSGIDQLKYTVSDKDNKSKEYTINIVINPISGNTAPVANAITPAAFNEDTQSIITLSYSDVDGDSGSSCTIANLTNVTISTACSCVAGVCSVGITGTSHYSGAASFSYTVTAAGQTSNSATASLTITAVDDAPVASNITPAAFNEDTQSVITLSYSDVESHSATTCTVSGLTNVTESTTCGCVAGVCTVGVTGLANYTGAASFNYTVTANGLTSNSATASLTISSVNDAPVTSAQTPAAFDEDIEEFINLPYTDTESEAATTCSISALTNVTETTTCTCVAGICSVGITGLSNYNGTASFNYTVTATGQTSNSSSVSLSINPVNDAPIISGTPISISTSKNSPVSGTFSATDIESDPITFSLVSDGSDGSAVVNADGTYTYTPSPGFSGADSFEILANDGTDDSITVTVSVTVSSTLVCPGNYKKIDANVTLGTDEFCVMVYEAKDMADGKAHSVAAGIPWVNITPAAARTACQENGTTFDLISNREWMAIAYLIEGRMENWISGFVGTGSINRGHTDSSSGLLSITNAGDFYNQTGNSTGAGPEQSRAFFISDSDYIWDFAGNAWEWVDWTTYGPIDTGFTSCGYDAWFEVFEIASNCAAPNTLDYAPLNPASNPGGSYGTSYNLGAIYGTANAGFGMALRGGDHSTGSNAGIYSLALDAATGDTAGNIGFRCVFR